MRKQVYEINEDGVYIRDLLIESDESYPEYYTETPFPKDSNGWQLPFYRAKWNGTSWIEDMSQEDIDALNNQPKPPTTEEQLAKKDEQILELKQQQVAMNRTVETNSTSQQELIELLIDMGVL